MAVRRYGAGDRIKPTVMASPCVARIDLYPLKAFDTVAVETAVVLPTGALQDDRRWAFLDAQDRFVNGKLFAETHRIRTVTDLAARTASFDGQPFALDGDVAPLEAWLSERLATPVRLRENRAAGFPDDTDSPGPTLISTATLETVAGWFDLTLAATRARFRANLEIGGVPAFWEDGFYGGVCRIGDVSFVMNNPCARCVVPSRDARSGEVTPLFQKRFAERRRATLAADVDPTPFNHHYRLAVNTRLAPPHSTGDVPRGGTIRLGDAITAGAAAPLETTCPS
jgi:uncharacterized protein YcbX